MTTTYVCELALLPDGEVAADVAVDVEDGRITRVAPGEGRPETAAGGPGPGGGAAPPERVALRGLVLPGLADAHSHAFHRALRGRTHGGGGDFWSWRDAMYAVADRLTPHTYLALARAAFAESVRSGFTAVGEFHYLHHATDGLGYDDPNEMGHVLVRAAREAGVRLTLLDACYLAGGFDRPIEGVQRRFADADATAWRTRVDALHDAYADTPDVVVGAAVHSVRAVPFDELAAVEGWARDHDAPLHVHLAEQPAENDACRAAHGVSPTRLLHDAGVLRPRTTAVHALHVDADDIGLLGDAGVTVCRCPTTERDLADGVGPVRELLDAGARLAFGTDSRALVDGFAEARAAEMDARTSTLRRGVLRPAELADALTVTGQACLGFDDAGRIEVGARADLVAVRLDSLRTAGATPDVALPMVLFAASARDVTDVVVDGEPVVRHGRHLRLGDVGPLLQEAVAAVVGGTS